MDAGIVDQHSTSDPNSGCPVSTCSAFAARAAERAVFPIFLRVLASNLVHLVFLDLLIPASQYFPFQEQKDATGGETVLEGSAATLGLFHQRKADYVRGGEEGAFAKFRTLMQQPQAIGDHVVTVYDLSQVYFDWCQKHRAGHLKKSQEVSQGLH